MPSSKESKVRNGSKVGNRSEKSTRGNSKNSEKRKVSNNTDQGGEQQVNMSKRKNPYNIESNPWLEDKLPEIDPKSLMRTTMVMKRSGAETHMMK